MIIFDFRLGHFSILAQREPNWHAFKVTREGPGEIAVDLPSATIVLTDYRRTVSHSQ
ncbi:hypothetical protein [Roseobacter sp. S98]|uniref:hypothetical protein n=1 Tax=Roseobacter algicola (ex Choi et al. 2025) (nom. illeg.) TaxID=3092138 RepID=UPI0035C6A7DE